MGTRVTSAAAVLEAPGRVRLDRCGRPGPAPGEVLVEVEGCGVCASSLPVWEGRPWFGYPLPAGAPGHEAWGRLDDGTRVAFLGGHGFAEWAVADETTLVEIPPELDDVPFPGEALGCAVDVVRRARLRSDDRVAIVGMGFLGSAVAQLCAARGVEVVPLGRGSAVPDGTSFPVVIEAGGVQETLDVASSLVAVGGRLVIAGFHQDGPRGVDMQSWNWRGLDVVNAHERDPAAVVACIREAARHAAAGALDLERLVTHRFPLARLADAFHAAATRPDGFVKAWTAP